jgi:Phosphatidylinositol 3- and 4-kinase/Phosphoinositide 3-kinase family, accessory domain (PIK domain)/Phosphoinositide 3-kinase C2/PI3-kinase family, ras-binding domain
MARSQSQRVIRQHTQQKSSSKAARLLGLGAPTPGPASRTRHESPSKPPPPLKKSKTTASTTSGASAAVPRRSTVSPMASSPATAASASKLSKLLGASPNEIEIQKSYRRASVKPGESTLELPRQLIDHVRNSIDASHDLVCNPDNFSSKSLQATLQQLSSLLGGASQLLCAFDSSGQQLLQHTHRTVSHRQTIASLPHSSSSVPRTRSSIAATHNSSVPRAGSGASTSPFTRAATHMSAISERKAFEPRNPLGTASHLTTLLELHSLKWRFRNQHVKVYRAAAAATEHPSVSDDARLMPAFVSSVPLPELKGLHCIVHLPESGSDETVHSHYTHRHTAVGLDDTTPASKVIAKALQRFQRSVSSVDQTGDNASVASITNAEAHEFALKVRGMSEYLLGDMLVLDDWHVRHCIRHHRKIELMLVPRVEPENVHEKVLAERKDRMNKYLTRLADRSVEPPNPAIYTELPSIGEYEVNQTTAIPLQQIETPYRVKVCGASRLTGSAAPLLVDHRKIQGVFVRSFLTAGVELISDTLLDTRITALSPSPRWMQWLTTAVPGRLGVQMKNLLPTTRVAFLLYGVSDANNHVSEELLLGWCSIQLLDEYGRLTTGIQSLNLWASDPNAVDAPDRGADLAPEDRYQFFFRATNRDNQSGAPCVQLHIELESFVHDVVSPFVEYCSPEAKLPAPSIVWEDIESATKQHIAQVLESDALYRLTASDKMCIWKARHHLVDKPQALPKFLEAVDWRNPQQRYEAHVLLQHWHPPTSAAASVELLGSRFADTMVRDYAVQFLASMDDDQLILYLLQLVQCLKCEPHHSSSLSRLLISRALQSPHQIGHALFWHLRSVMHSADYCERYTLMLEEYLSFCGGHAEELRKQHLAVLHLQQIASSVVKWKRSTSDSDATVKQKYHELLHRLNEHFFERIGSFQLPLDPRYRATTLVVDKCRYMSSKKVPLWLVFRNAHPDGDNITVMFKSGDDLRQDILTLQMLQLMDALWLAEGLDLRMKPYTCVSTGVDEDGEGVGMIEIVQNAATLGHVQRSYGGRTGALQDNVVSMYLDENNTDDKTRQQATDNFVRSCAGYCMASNALGLGDRHSDNVMVTRTGHLFHIDFGHFLGNFKTKMGIRREREAFVFTKAMAFVMGGENASDFKRFKDLCFQAYQILRKNAHTLINMFVLMVSAGMPELASEDDVSYMRDMLRLDLKTDKEVRQHIESEINRSLSTTMRRIDDFFHNNKHYKA